MCYIDIVENMKSTFHMKESSRKAVVITIAAFCMRGIYRKGKAMIRGTTPTHVFTIKFDTSNIKEVLVSYAQRGNLLFEKRTKDCEMNGNKIVINLTQEETLKFDCKYPAQIQLRVLTTDGKAMASHVIKDPVDFCLSEVVLK